MTAAAAGIRTSVPLALYVHFPWCVRKCPYCDFNSHQLRGEIPEIEYIAALVRDLDHELSVSPATGAVTSVFLGGGTPSLFSGRGIGVLLDKIVRRVTLAGDAEITLEANPGTVDEQHFRDYRSAGINRLSIGVQSLDAGHLQALGRIHDPAAARRAVEVARRAGFDNLNLDMMFALPRQTAAEAARDLEMLCELAPEHVSYYHLTLEPNTEFAKRPPPVPDSDAAYAMLERGMEILEGRGYVQYEVSAYAQPGRASRHNLNYWQFGDYIGVGAGAHGKRTQAADATSTGIVRRSRTRHPRAFLEAAGGPGAIQEERAIAAADLPFEFAMNALRLNEGFTFAQFESRTGLDRRELDAGLSVARSRGLVDVAGERVRPSKLGRAHLNALLQLFLP